jgi:hypothetical protein
MWELTTHIPSVAAFPRATLAQRAPLALSVRAKNRRSIIGWITGSR